MPDHAAAWQGPSRDVDKPQAALTAEPLSYIDRDYQKRAILAVEQGLADGRRELLVAMATGTGKTRTCIRLCCRLLEARRFRRVLFIVVRTSRGEWTANALKGFRLETLQTVTHIFEVRALADLQPNRETKLRIATIQAMTHARARRSDPAAARAHARGSPKARPRQAGFSE